jgi:hypothetical protein
LSRLSGICVPELESGPSQIHPTQSFPDVVLKGSFGSRSGRPFAHTWRTKVAAMTVLPSQKLRDHAQAAMFEWDAIYKPSRKSFRPPMGVHRSSAPGGVVVVQAMSTLDHQHQQHQRANHVRPYSPLLYHATVPRRQCSFPSCHIPS